MCKQRGMINGRNETMEKIEEQAIVHSAEKRTDSTGTRDWDEVIFHGM